MENKIVLGDCLAVLKDSPAYSVSLVYLDPPFFTGKEHKSCNKDATKSYSFSDVWRHSEAYLEFLSERLAACKRVMRQDASIFLHCDRNGTHIARQALDLVFGEENFQSEIIWSYKRWSNSKRGLLQQHQTILFYSRSAQFKWNPSFVDYSATTNIDQILQKRSRDARGKAAYATDEAGNVVYGDSKKGVPLGDVWEIPFLNPKAKERTGYPTQKPLLLLERIVELTTNEGDLVLDPFCGSGTTVVAAKLLGRRYLGIDISLDAVKLANERLKELVRTDSALLRQGVDAYINDDPWIEAHLTGLSFIRIQRNAGADAILKETINGQLAFVRVQRQNEPLSLAANALKKVISSKGAAVGVLIATKSDLFALEVPDIYVLPSPAMQLDGLTQRVTNDSRVQRMRA